MFWSKVRLNITRLYAENLFIGLLLADKNTALFKEVIRQILAFAYMMNQERT
jgi:hypothetical protein